MSECKHCHGPLMDDGQRHATTIQRGKNRCPVEPYGYNGCEEGVPCDFTCLGSLSDPPPITKVY